MCSRSLCEFAVENKNYSTNYRNYDVQLLLKIQNQIFMSPFQRLTSKKNQCDGADRVGK